MSKQRDLNVSQFIANLNSLEPVDFPTSQPNHEEELSIFSNTHFFDFDMGRSTNISATVDDLLMQQEKELQNPKGKSKGEGEGEDLHPGIDGNGTTPLDFDTLQQFSLAGELPLFNHHDGSGSGIATPYHQVQAGPSSTSTIPIQNSIYNINNNNTHPLQDGDLESLSKRRRLTSGGSSVGSSASGSTGNSIDLTAGDTPKGSSNVSAEEDKRRRNTAASARFRIKKKLREQEMERTAREMQEKIQQLEGKVTQLQMENRWLRNLVVEKNEARDVSELLNLKSRIISSADPLVKSEEE